MLSKFWSNDSFDNEIKEMRIFLRDIRRDWLIDREKINPNQDYHYEYSYTKSEVEGENLNPCTNCCESKGRKKYVTECTHENGKEKGRAFTYCDNCGKTVEYDWDNAKQLEGEKSKQQLGQKKENFQEGKQSKCENAGSLGQSHSQNMQSETHKQGPEIPQKPEQDISGSQTHSH